jgi:hypothetical protein
MTEQKNDKTSTGNSGAASSTNPSQAAKEVEAMHVGEPQSGDGGNADVQAQMDEANDKGYFGVTTDPTPNEHYTASGVNKGLPTPETDPAQAEKVRAHQAHVRATGAEPTAEDAKDK